MRARLVLIVLAFAGCLEKQTLVPCGESFCVGNTTCVADRCVTAEELAACQGLADGASCVFEGATGRCMGGLCLAVGCGNSIVDVATGEVCDDGNTTSGDGCRADCQKIEMCGDAILDDGEGCDDGNANPADGCDACGPTEWIAMAIIGSSALGTEFAMARPSDVAVDRNGIAFIVDTGGNRIRRLHPNGTMSIVAGTGDQGFSGDGGLATDARFSAAQGIALDTLGNIYIADSSNARIRKIDKRGVITTIAGTGSAVSGGGDGGPALLASFNRPTAVAVDGDGNLYIAEQNAHRVRKVDTAGTITTIAGTGVSGFSGDGGAATSAQLGSPRGLALDAAGNLYIADNTNRRIRKVDTSGIITTVAGSGVTTGSCVFSGDGGPATGAVLCAPTRVALDLDGRLYISDSANQRIRRVALDGTITTIAGSGAIGSGNGGFSGDGGPASAARLADPDGIGVDLDGNLFIVDSTNHRLRRVTSSGTISTVAGSGQNGHTGDGGTALASPLLGPTGVSVDAMGNVYFPEQLTHRVRRVAVDGTITTIAGTGTSGLTGDGGPAVVARLDNPTKVLAVGTDVYIADSVNHVIRKVDAAGTISRVAGTGTSGSADHATDARLGQLNFPTAMAFRGGELYIADTSNSRIRKVTAAGALTTIAGSTAGFSGDGGPAASAQLSGPSGLAFDADGNLLIADRNNHRIRMIDTNGDISTIAGTGTSGFSGDDGPPLSAQLAGPSAVAVDAGGAIYIADFSNRRIRKIAAGVISTIAGTGTVGFSGDGGPATSAKIDAVGGIDVDALGRVYIADAQLGTGAIRVVRRIDTDGTIRTIAGGIDPLGAGPLATGTLAAPVAATRLGAETIFAGGARGIVQMFRSGATSVETVAGRYPQTVPASYGATAEVGDLARYRGSAFGSIDGIAYDDASKRIFIAQASTHSILAISVVDAASPATWTIAPFANTAGTAGHADGPVASATFKGPNGLHLIGTTLYVADTGNHVVRAIDLSTSQVSTVAGTPLVRGFFGDGVPPLMALLNEPRAITSCPNGDLFVADTTNHRVRRIAGGLITTVIGDGNPGSSGEGGPAFTFPVDAPVGMACDALGNLYVTSTNVVRLLPANDAGIVDGQGEVQTIYALPPREEYPASAAVCLSALLVVDTETLHVTDACTGLLVELRRKPAN